MNKCIWQERYIKLTEIKKIINVFNNETLESVGYLKDPFSQAQYYFKLLTKLLTSKPLMWSTFTRKCYVTQDVVFYVQ